MYDPNVPLKRSVQLHQFYYTRKLVSNIAPVYRYLTLKTLFSVKKESLNNPTIHYLIKTSYKQKSACMCFKTDIINTLI